MTGPEQEGERDDTGPHIDPDLDYDAAFAALIARFNDDNADDNHENDHDNENDHENDDSNNENGAGESAAPEHGPGSGSGSGSAEPVAPKPVSAEPVSPAWHPSVLDEHFEPPDPPPLPRGDRISRAAWSGVLGGPALLLIAALLNGALPSWMVALALLCFVAGFVTLVARMPAERPDDGDDGAVI